MRRDCFAKLIYKVKATSVKILAVILAEIEFSQKTVLKKKTNVEGFKLPDFRVLV